MNQADYINAFKQRAILTKTTSRATVANVAHSLIDVAGQPGAGVLAGTNAVSGVVPTAADAGYPTLVPFAAGATGSLTRLAFSSSVACRLSIYDRLFLAGTFPFNAAATLANQPSIAGRLPGGNARNVELWVEWVAVSTGIPVITVTYTNDLGVPGRTTGPVSLLAAQAAARCTQLPLQAGDQGILKIESVTCTGATAGTFNMMLLRSLLADGVRVRSANDGDTMNMYQTGLQTVYDTSAIYMTVTTDLAVSGFPSATIEITSA